jgi:hypothetical protein
MGEHTPTPWKLHAPRSVNYPNDGPPYGHSIYAENRSIANPVSNDGVSPDAAFIVKAVNSHDALVDTLKFLLETLEMYCIQRGTDISSPTPESAIGRARAVLASLAQPPQPGERRG